MSDLDAINSVLSKTARRRRWFRAWNGLFSGLMLAASVWLLATIIFKLAPIPFGVFGVLGVFAMVSVVGGFFWGGRRIDSPLETAQWVDQRLSLKEKLSAAVEFSRSSAAWGDVLLRDGVKCLEQVQPAKLLAYRLPKAARWTVLLLLLSATLGFVPEYRSESYLNSKREAAVIQETGEHLSSFAKRALSHRPPKMKPTEKAMVAVDELGQQLKSAKLSRADALEKIASVSDKLKDQAKNLGENPAFKRMRQEARTPTGAPSSTAKALQERIQSLQKEMKNASGDPKALEKMKSRLDQLQRAAAGMNSDESGMTPEMEKQMAQSLANLSQMAKNEGLPMSDLEDALSALKDGNMDKLLKSLDSAQVDLEKMMAMAKAMQKMKMDLAEIGKDLGEQLEKGQAQAAHDRLLEMAAKMESGESQEGALEKIMAEVAKAIDPAGDYGEVKERLEEALKSAQEGNSQASADSMRAAAAELKKLLEQYGDMESLMASLDALNKAQLCVGNCMGWGQCKSGIPKIGPGGKPGRGVGTWAEETNGWFYFPETQDRWDNSDLTRPDMDARGYTDRGAGQLPNGMIPTKIKGNFSPGGPMPSITLRGVSIKGESRVVMEEAITAAQDEAQSALSQQKVPRAYQQAVRNYFDDFAQ